MTSMKLTALFMKVPEGYVAFIEELPFPRHEAGRSDSSSAVAASFFAKEATTPSISIGQPASLRRFHATAR
jgi:hypothetical protein